MSAERVIDGGVVLHDGRSVRVHAYDDGNVRLTVDGGTYVIADCAVSGSRAVVTLTRPDGPSPPRPAKAYTVEGQASQAPKRLRTLDRRGDTRLRDRYLAGANVDELSREFGGKPSAITSRLARLGLATTDAPNVDQ